MSKHTPGPWKICYDGQIDGPKGKHVCSFRWTSFKEFNESEEGKATARLIAAAPEMLEALKLSLRALEESNPDSQEKLCDNARTIIYKAIVKAEGNNND